MVGGEPSHADPANSTKDSWLDRGWPLTRFLGYRPPPPHPHAAKDATSPVDHILPAPLREKRRAKAQEKYEREHGTADENGVRRSESGTVVGSPDEASAEKGKGEQKPPSLGEKVRAKLWNMLLTLFGCFFGIAFGALGEYALFAAVKTGDSFYPMQAVAPPISDVTADPSFLRLSVPKLCSCGSEFLTSIETCADLASQPQLRCPLFAPHSASALASTELDIG